MKKYLQLLLVTVGLLLLQACASPSPATGEGWQNQVGGPPQNLDEKAAELRQYSKEEAPAQPAKARPTTPRDNPMERLDNQLRAIDSQRR